MSDLFLPPLEMMGLTFALGFFVAFIIKLIASAADSLDFDSSHQQELLRLRRIKKFRQKMELMLHLSLIHISFTVYYPLSPPLYIDIKKNY